MADDTEKDETHIDNLLDMFEGKSSTPADESNVQQGIPAGTGSAIKKTEKTGRPSTWDVGKHILNTVANAPNTKIGEQLADPVTAAALAAGAAGLYRSGAGINPLKPETFMQYQPRYTPPGSQPRLGGVHAYLESQLVPKVGTEGLSEATGKNVRTMHEAQEALKDVSAQPRTEKTLYRQVGGERKPVGARFIPAKPAVELVPQQSTLGRMGSTIAKAAPGLGTTGEWLKGALPTLGTVGKYAGIGGLLGDVGARAYSGDTTGAGISGVGGALGMMLAPEIGIPVALGSAAINYLRDHPEHLEALRSKIGNLGDMDLSGVQP